MFRFIVFRILWFIPVLLIASFCIFYLLRLNGTDPISQYLSLSNLRPTQELIDSLTIEFGLDKSLFSQYVIWLKNALFLDFGTSYMSGRSVSEDFFYFLPNTLLLVLGGFIITLICSIPLGVISFYFKNRLPDTLIRLFCFIGVCVPNFWLAFLLLLVFVLYFGWLPGLGLEDAKSLILPCVSIALMSICINTRLIRANMLSVANERYVMFARLRGLDEKKLAFKHIFYNASLPIITAFGMHIGELIGGAILIESIFGIAGIGAYSIQGIINNDYPIIQCFVLVLCVIFCVCNLAVDILLGILDPRIRKHIK